MGRECTANGIAGAWALTAAVLAGCSTAESHAPLDATTDGTEAEAGAPSLIMLSVTTTNDPTSELVPPFSPELHDYYVPCAIGMNTFTITMSAAAGGTSSLIAPTPSVNVASQTLSVVVGANEAIVAAATSHESTTSYWVRCLPPDFPRLTMTAFPDAGAPADGYYLVGNAVVSEGEAGYVMVLNGQGVPVWYHHLGAGLAAGDVDHVASGALSFIPTSFVGYDPFEVETFNPEAQTLLAPKGFTADEHELQVLPNGDYLVFSYSLKGGFDLTGLSITKAFDAGILPLGPNSTIQDCTIVEFDSSGAVHWTWSASDHFDPALDSTYPQTGFGPGAVLPEGGTAFDLYHCNSIDIDPTNGNLLVSARGMDSVFYLEKSTGKVLWKMGGAKASLDGARFVAVADPFYRQHDARLGSGFQPDCHGGTGEVSLFDDQTGEPGPARGVVYDVVVGGGPDGGCDGGETGGGGPGQARVGWQYKGRDVSGGGGSVRESSDGSRVVGWGIGIPVFTEVSAAGNKLRELQFTAGDVSYRAIKVPLNAFDLNALRSTAGR